MIMGKKFLINICNKHKKSIVNPIRSICDKLKNNQCYVSLYNLFIFSNNLCNNFFHKWTSLNN